ARLESRSVEGQLEGLARGGDRRVERLVIVCQRGEPRLELGGGRIDPAIEQGTAEAAVRLRIASLSAGEVPHRIRAEEHRQEAGNAAHLHGTVAGRVAQPG